MRIKRNLQGISLISLLVGVSIGAFLLVVMLQIFSTTRANYRLSENLAEMNNVLRYASLVMTDVISQAGYRTPDATTGVLPDYSTAFPTFTGTIDGPGGTYNSGDTNADDPAGLVISYFPGQGVIPSAGGVDPYDKLWLKFHGDPSGRIRACGDLYGVENVPIRVKFYSQQLTIDSVDSTAYYCENQNDATDYTYLIDAPIGTELIPAALFDQAWVRYGVSYANNNPSYIDGWNLGPDVQDRTRVFAVRIAFLVHTRDDVRSEDVTQTFSVFNETVTRTSKKIYKLYIFTVMLPNAPGYALASTVTTP